GCERLDEMNVRAGLGEREGDRAGAAVEVEHLRSLLRVFILLLLADAEQLADRGVDALGLTAVRLYEGAVRRAMRRTTDAIGRGRETMHDDGLRAEDLRRVPFMEVQR